MLVEQGAEFRAGFTGGVGIKQNWIFRFLALGHVFGIVGLCLNMVLTVLKAASLLPCKDEPHSTYRSLAWGKDLKGCSRHKHQKGTEKNGARACLYHTASGIG